MRRFSLSWPKSGTTANGAVLTQRTSGLPKAGSGCSSWDAQTTLSDALEYGPDERLYLSQEQINLVAERVHRAKYHPKGSPEVITVLRGPSQGQRVYDPKGLSVTLCSQGGGFGRWTGLYTFPERVSRAVMNPGFARKSCNGRTIKAAEDPSFALTATDVHGVATAPAKGDKGIVQIDGQIYNVRRLSPRECFRLQGFPDELFDRAEAVCSESRLYKQAGNAVTATVAYEFGRRILEMADS